MVGGHEGAGVVEAVGPGVTRVDVGDHVVCSFIPACGICRYCSTGHQNLCDWGAQMMTGMLADGSFRFHDDDGADLGGFCMLGTFAERAVVSQNSCVPIDADIPFEVAALTGCGVPTGWGTAVYAAGVRAGETVVIFGAGGVGSNAVQGAKHAGAANVIVVDPVAFKRESVQPARRHPPAAAPLPGRAAQARRAHHPPLLTGRHQRRLPGPGRRQDHPRRHHPLAAGSAPRSRSDRGSSGLT